MDAERKSAPTVTYEIFQRVNGRWIPDGKFINEGVAIDTLNRRRLMSNSKYRLVRTTTEVIDSDLIE